MLTTILIAAVAIAQAYGTPQPQYPAPAASAAATSVPPIASAVPAIPTGRGLKDLQGTTVTYYDVPGKNGAAIEKSLKTMLADPALKDTVRLLAWGVSTAIVKRTTGTKCTVQSANSTLSSKVRLPRLAEQAKVDPATLARWNAYVAGIEGEAAADLWFVSDHLRGAEQSLVGVSCDQAGTAWNAQVEIVKSQLKDFMAQRAHPAPRTGSSGLQPVQVPNRSN